jgi:hypothetical protein
VLGEIVTSLAQGEPTRFDISHLDPGRFPELSGDDVIEP